MGIMEALEHLLSLDERPKRTFYIAFGHDEEVTGFQVNFHQFDTLANSSLTNILPYSRHPNSGLVGCSNN